MALNMPAACTKQASLPVACTANPERCSCRHDPTHQQHLCIGLLSLEVLPNAPELRHIKAARLKVLTKQRDVGAVQQHIKGAIGVVPLDEVLKAACALLLLGGEAGNGGGKGVPLCVAQLDALECATWGIGRKVGEVGVSGAMIMREVAWGDLRMMQTVH